jgi:hypothetical protein
MSDIAPKPYDPTPESPVYLVYFTGMTDCVTAEQFATHNWNEAWSGPLVSGTQIDTASRGLVLDPLCGEIDMDKSLGWHLYQAQHPFVSSEKDPRYCAGRSEHIIDPASPTPCDLHARHHADAPPSLRAAGLRLITPCRNTRVDRYWFSQDATCDQMATEIYEKHAYCAKCATEARALVVTPCRYGETFPEYCEIHNEFKLSSSHRPVDALAVGALG